MIINLTDGISSSSPDAKILISLIDQMMIEYKHNTFYSIHDVWSALLLTKQGSQEFIRWAKIRFNLKLRFFDIPVVDKPSESMLIGYEITEDEYFTKYLLESKND